MRCLERVKTLAKEYCGNKSTVGIRIRTRLVFIFQNLFRNSGQKKSGYQKVAHFGFQIPTVQTHVMYIHTTYSQNTVIF